MSWGNEQSCHITSDLISLDITWPGACEVWARTGAAMRLRGPGGRETGAGRETEPRLRHGPWPAAESAERPLQCCRHWASEWAATMGTGPRDCQGWWRAANIDFPFPRPCIATHSRVVITVSMPGASIITMSVSEVTISCSHDVCKLQQRGRNTIIICYSNSKSYKWAAARKVRPFPPDKAWPGGWLRLVTGVMTPPHHTCNGSCCKQDSTQLYAI